MNTWTIARQIAFFAPANMKGKWHAAHLVDNTTVCGTAVELGQEVIRTTAGKDSAAVHPLLCRRCLLLSTTSGVSATGMKR